MNVTLAQIDRLPPEKLKRLHAIWMQGQIIKARSHLIDFTDLTFKGFHWTDFHKMYYGILDRFAKGQIKNLIITVPPQHGKSLGSTIKLPAFMFGNGPDKKIAIASYSDTFAKSFNRKVQLEIDNEVYARIFPETSLNRTNIVTTTGSWLRNSSEFEIVNHKGSLKAVGRGGPLTGNPVDVMIMDDLYKDYAEGNSPVIREAVKDWYTSVVRSRLHNGSQQLIVFTRWHEDDLIGYLEQKEEVIAITDLSQLNGITNEWVKINFEAIKNTPPSGIDQRGKGQPLFPERHSIEKLISERNFDADKFECLFQGNPMSQSGLLYKPFKTYSQLPEGVRKNKTDTADTGDDYLCSICYIEDVQGYCHVTDVYYTQEQMEVTESETAEMILRNETDVVDIESNNGGRGFARRIDDLTPAHVTVNWYHQSKNKESRIFTNSAKVNKMILFPEGWQSKWPEFYNHVRGYKKNFKANKHDDAADVLTSMVEQQSGGIVEDIEWN